jgi:hypothetical protein
MTGSMKHYRGSYSDSYNTIENVRETVRELGFGLIE